MGFNDDIIDEFRSNGGAVSRGFGTDLVLVHSTGAQSGAERIHPVLALRDGDAWLIAASKGGAPEHPAWYHNLVAHPEAEIEVPDLRGGIDTVAVRADVLSEGDHDAAWARFLDRSPAFAQYDERSGARRIPVVRLSRR
jgi:deazaflavin-dependent oxidoreductase (nitroreductase family)